MSLIRDIVVFLCGFLIVDTCVAQITSTDRCPEVTVVQDFQPEKYLGKWYEAEKYFAIFEVGGKCVTATYSDLGNGTISVVNAQINTLLGNTPKSIAGTASIPNPSEGRLAVSFPGAPFPAPYLVLDTDYTSYALVWSCTDVKLGFSLRFSWILTREQNPPESVLQKAYEAAARNKIDREPYQKTEQTDCPKKRRN